MLALTFINKNDYYKIRENDVLEILGLTSFEPSKPLIVNLIHSDGSNESFRVSHSYNQQQIGWFKAGSALNDLK